MGLSYANLVTAGTLISRMTSAELTAACSTPAGVAALFQLVVAGPVDITLPATMTLLAPLVVPARAAAILVPTSATVSSQPALTQGAAAPTLS